MSAWQSFYRFFHNAYLSYLSTNLFEYWAIASANLPKILEAKRSSVWLTTAVLLVPTANCWNETGYCPVNTIQGESRPDQHP
ncbi:MAG: hypothetical protein AAFY26_07900 [Cyanobacteria bacterium J06638_22]